MFTRFNYRGCGVSTPNTLMNLLNDLEKYINVNSYVVEPIDDDYFVVRHIETDMFFGAYENKDVAIQQTKNLIDAENYRIKKLTNLDFFQKMMKLEQYILKSTKLLDYMNNQHKNISDENCTDAMKQKSYLLTDLEFIAKKIYIILRREYSKNHISKYIHQTYNDLSVISICDMIQTNLSHAKEIMDIIYNSDNKIQVSFSKTSTELQLIMSGINIAIERTENLYVYLTRTSRPDFGIPMNYINYNESESIY